jgi:hypothetical protein
MSCLNADTLRARLLAELEAARKSQAEARAKGDQRWLDRAAGVEALAKVLLLSYGSVWAGLTTVQKRDLDAGREEKERLGRNAASRARAAERRAQVAHLAHHWKPTGSTGPDWWSDGGTPECDSRRGLSPSERDEWPKANRIVKTVAEVTCADCCGNAAEKGIAGAEERLRIIWRKEEAHG